MPYINIQMDLYDQLKYLSAAVHIMTVLFTFSEVCGTFIPSQLYQDIQVAVKNVFFCVAKAKRDNPNGKFFIYQLGTNQLEWIFGWIRLENGSDVNVDIYSLSTHSASTVECNAILAEKPEWDRGPQRLKLQPVYDKGAIEGKVDHINTASWKGDVCLSNVDLRSAWMSGQ